MEPVKYIWGYFALNLSFLLSEIAIRFFLGHPLLCGYLLVAAKVASNIFVNHLNATNLKSSKTQFRLELSLAQLSPSLFDLTLYCGTFNNVQKMCGNFETMFSY